jgi:N-acetylglucosaminyl-diphospho-decaprenol L-rhamnosyltransferase
MTTEGNLKTVAVSIVSHGHGEMVNRLVSQLAACPEVGQIILTRNIHEATPLPSGFPCEVIENAAPKGFGANHNAAFHLCRQPCYCVLNPDIELIGNPFSGLLEYATLPAGVVLAPLIVAPGGSIEDSARQFPTLVSLARKVLGGHDGRYRLARDEPPREVDWVAGMFLLFSSSDFQRLGGFDERYFLYYEDVDICARAWRNGMKVKVVPSVAAIHDARRDSHRSFRHMRWHVASMLRFLASGLGKR